MVDVQALNIKQRLALLTDGRMVPITTLIDGDGEETQNLSEAVSFVCGSGREWFSDLISHYEAVTVQ